MGWWRAHRDGCSFGPEEQDEANQLYWGDAPADAIDNALDTITKEFEEALDRKPTRQELISGLLFSINVDWPADASKESHRLFQLVRYEDVHGVSGTGIVAEGVQFSDGQATLHWIVGDHRCTSSWNSVEDVIAVHGHEGKTVIVWL